MRLFVVDSPEETRKVAEAAPGTSVLCRIVTSGNGSDWPLSRKYGCSTAEAVTVLRLAAELGLDPAGVSFHVGSQQRDPSAWDAPIEASSRVFAALRREGLAPWLLDLGGGFPAALEGGAPALDAYGDAITRSLKRHFAARRPQTLIEPGRSVVADAGRVVTSVVAVVRRGETRWVYLDAGVFTGLVETLDEAIRYRLETDATGPTGPCVLAGPRATAPTCSTRSEPVQLPLALVEGDEVVLRSAGAYTTCYSTVGFNGFDPLPTVLLDARVSTTVRRLVASHALAAVGMSLPWPLLLLLVWEQTHSGVLGVRRARPGCSRTSRSPGRPDGSPTAIPATGSSDSPSPPGSCC